MSLESSDVVFLPGAGSFGSEFQGLIRGFAPAAWLLRYPGRFGKDFGVSAGSFEEVVESCLAQLDRRKTERPVLVGHSYGAYVGYAVAARLPEVGGLVVAGATAPSRHAVLDSAIRSRPDLAAYLDDIAPGWDTADDWKDVVLDTTLQDLLLLKEFSAADHKELHCPIHVARGAQDPLTTDDGIDEWRSATSGGFTSRVFAGGHSDLLRDPEFMTWLSTVTERPRKDENARDSA